MSNQPKKAAPHVQAAFINALAEEGTKEEVIFWLQKTWNERCALADALREITKIEARPVAEGFVTGPQAHFDQAKRIARDALQPKATP